MSEIQIFNQIVYGLSLNAHSGCLHHHTPLDIIAIRFKCCNRYYACFACHETLADHKAEVWRAEEFNENAVLCGHCGHEMTIREYLLCNNRCLKCHAQFNPGCKSHWHFYFEN